MMCQPNWVCTGLLMSPGFCRAKAASSKDGTMAPRENQFRSPPRALVPSSWEYWAARAAKSLPCF